ncbi:MAG: polysaccharide biosynthesis protein [Anaerolinea sp.]|nr:polysaccharide biosynthesis protein [Anaerolinea sp.]
MDEKIKSKPKVRNRYILLGDLILIPIVVLGSFAARLELGSAFQAYVPMILWMSSVALVVKPIVYYQFGLYRRIWIYASVQELRLIVAAVSTASVITFIIMLALFQLRLFSSFSRSVMAIDWLASMLAVGGLRFTFRLLAENRTNPHIAQSMPNTRRVLVVGAGDAGVLVVREMQKNSQLNLVPIGFLDDASEKQKNQIYGVPVVGKLNDMSRVLENRQVDEVIIAIPSAPGRVIRQVADICRLKGIPFRTMPGMYELIGGKVSVTRLREVDITDLLRRDPTHIDNERVGEVISGKSILVTGAGGSIGRELCRQIARWKPREIILLGHGENSIFESLIELQEDFPSLAIHPVIADIQNLRRLQEVFVQYRPNVVFHAAAHKHVPLMEMNISEAVLNNVQGTRNVVSVSVASDVERFVLISTDKAIRPINVMGATKRLAEMIVLDAARRTGRSFTAVRFGNVLGSRGSVVPLFKRQISRGGPVTITHPDMKRYFMTIPEAVHLVLQSSALGIGGEVFVLNMGQQVRILDLARDLIRLSGLEPGRDIEIVFTGIRPGEKLSEDLWDEGHSFSKTTHPDIYKLDGQDALAGAKLEKSMDELFRLAQEDDSGTIVKMMDELIPGSAVKIASTPDITFLE